MSLPSSLDEYVQKLKNSRTYTDQTSDSPLWQSYTNPGNPSNIEVKASWAGDWKNWDDYYNYARMLNSVIRNQYRNDDFGGRADFIASIPNVINTSRWMDQLWNYIKHMPANQFIFPGCHDALSGYTVTSISTAKAKTQENQTIPQMLDAGCRYFDIRFVGGPHGYLGTQSVPDIQYYIGVHSAVTFDVNVSNFVDALKNFFSDNRKDIVVINLQLLSRSTLNLNTLNLNGQKEETECDSGPYNDFINYLTRSGLGNKLISAGNPNASLESLSVNGGIIFLASNDFGNQYYWGASKHEDDVINWSSEETPQEWLSVILEGEYLSTPLSNNNVFHHLSMTQTDKVPIDAAKRLNGPLADWILYANPNSNFVPSGLIGLSAAAINQLNTYGFGTMQFVLPYKPYLTSQGTRDYMQNYNLISMDFYDMSPFIINSIAQNLIASQKFPQQQISGVVDIYQYVQRMDDQYQTQVYMYSPVNTVPLGYTSNGPSFKASATFVPGMVPVYAYLIHGTDSKNTPVYFLSLNPETPQSFIPLGIVFYAYAQQQPNTIPVYRYNIIAGDSARTQVYFYSTNSNTPPAFNSSGAVFWVPVS